MDGLPGHLKQVSRLEDRKGWILFRGWLLGKPGKHFFVLLSDHFVDHLLQYILKGLPGNGLRIVGGSRGQDTGIRSQASGRGTRY